MCENAQVAEQNSGFEAVVLNNLSFFSENILLMKKGFFSYEDLWANETM